MDHMSDEERAKIGAQLDLALDLIARRHGVSMSEAIEAIRWVQTHREFVSKLKNGGMMSLFGVFVTGLVLALWEGIKHFLWSGKQ